LTLAEESERRHLATHLHENLVQILGLIQIKLSMLDEAGSVKLADREDRTRELTSLVARAVDASQSLTHQLGHPTLYDLGFVAGAQRLAEDIETLYGKKVVVDDDDQPKPLNEPIRVMLFQCLRESLVNACKHAQVDVIQVRIRRIGDNVRVMVADRGVGFDPAGITSGQTRGFGLFSIRERLGYLGGRVDIRSSPGKGAVVSMTVPVDGVASDASAVPGKGPKAGSGVTEPDTLPEP
jgi:signal transduction histidine kinase